MLTSFAFPSRNMDVQKIQKNYAAIHNMSNYNGQDYPSQTLKRLSTVAARVNIRIYLFNAESEVRSRM